MAGDCLDDAATALKTWWVPQLGKAAVGRTTPDVLNINHPDRVELRRLLIAAGHFPP
jgi:hypothetical protein